MILPKEITIITPIANMAGRLETLKDWVAEGLKRGFEIILIHDIKDDQTESELTDFVKITNDKYLRLFSGYYGGPGLARNEGLRNTTTNWLCFFDADDEPNLENIEIQMKTITNDTDMVVGQYEVLDVLQGGKKIKSSTTRNLTDLMINPGLWRILLKKSFTKENEFPNLRMGEDQLFLVNLDLGNAEIEYSQKTFYQYYANQKTQLTRNIKALDDLRYSTKALKDAIKSTKQLDELYILYIRQSVSGLIRASYLTKIICLWRLASISFLRHPILIVKSLIRIRNGR
jgi:glycosyltransferase involved in cell wall biosynthesis